MVQHRGMDIDTQTAQRAKTARRRALARAGVLCAAVALAPAFADSRHDHDRARAALQSGEVMPLAALLEQVQRSHPGQVLELELEHEDGRWVYEIKLLANDGQLLKLDVDARTAQVLKVKRKDRSAAAAPAAVKP